MSVGAKVAAVGAMSMTVAARTRPGGRGRGGERPRPAIVTGKMELRVTEGAHQYRHVLGHGALDWFGRIRTGGRFCRNRRTPGDPA